MKCEDVQGQLLFYIDKELSVGESESIKDHLDKCKACEGKYKLHEETHKALQGFGRSVRTGLVDMQEPPLPPLPRHPLWLKIRDWFQTPIPLWGPSVASVAAIVMFMVFMFSPFEPSIEEGKEKGGGHADVVSPPLTAEAMLEFLIVPDPTDPGQLTASIDAVEVFLKSHPEDLAMHAKLVELYQAKLKLESASSSEHTVLAKKLSLERQRFVELLRAGNYIEGDEENAEE